MKASPAPVVSTGTRLASWIVAALTGGVEGYLPTILSSKGEMASESADVTSATVIPSPIMASTPELAAALRAAWARRPLTRRSCTWAT